MQSSPFILLNAGLAIHLADWNYPNIISPFARLYLVTHGNATVTINNEQRILQPGYLYLLPAFTMHSDHCNGPFSLYYIHFYEQKSNWQGIFDKFNLPFEVPSTPLHQQLIERLLATNPHRQLSQYDPKTYDNNSTLHQNIATSAITPIGVTTETTGILMMLLAPFLHVASPRFPQIDVRLQDALQYINMNPAENISINHLAQMACLSTDHFIRLFKKELGTTPLQYIMMRRMEKAQSMLMLTGEPIKIIAAELAFTSVPHFNKAFKAHTGMSPNNYRKMGQNA